MIFKNVLIKAMIFTTNKKNILSLLVLVLLISPLFIDVLIAQTAPTGAPTTPNTPAGVCIPPSTCAPIDGGISILTLLAAAFGLQKLYTTSKNKK